MLGLTTSQQTARRLAVVWGVHAVVIARDAHDDGNGQPRDADKAPAARASPPRGDTVVVAAGVPFGQPGTTNALRVASVR